MITEEDKTTETTVDQRTAEKDYLRPSMKLIARGISPGEEGQIIRIICYNLMYLLAKNGHVDNSRIGEQQEFIDLLSTLWMD
jgi:hypothetical protein